MFNILSQQTAAAAAQAIDSVDDQGLAQNQLPRPGTGLRVSSQSSTQRAPEEEEMTTQSAQWGALVPTPDQQAVYNTVAAQWRGGLSFALEAGTGFGKTAVACKLALDFVRGRISTGSAGAVAAKHEAGELFTGPLVAGTKSASSGFVEKMPDTETDVSIPVSRLRVGIFTRTNNQVGNIADEFERVALGEHQHKSPPSVVCLASRRELCLVPAVADVEDYTAGRRACLAEDCSYRDVKAPHLRTTHPLTTKLLKALGEKHHFCPYYAAKGLGSKADVVIASYPYFFGQRSAVGKLRLVIVDEAHNIRNASYKEVALSALKDDTHPASAVVQKKWADIPGGALEWPKEVGQEFVTALAQNSAAEAESDVFYELATLAAEKETKLVAKFLPTANYGKVVASPKLCFQHSPAIEDVRFQALEQRGGLALLMSGTLFTNPFADSLAQALPQGCAWACLRAPKPFRRKFVQISYGLDFAEFPDPTHRAEVRFLSTLLDKQKEKEPFVLVGLPSYAKAAAVGAAAQAALGEKTVVVASRSLGRSAGSDDVDVAISGQEVQMVVLPTSGRLAEGYNFPRKFTAVCVVGVPFAAPKSKRGNAAEEDVELAARVVMQFCGRGVRSSENAHIPHFLLGARFCGWRHVMREDDWKEFSHDDEYWRSDA